MTAPPLRLRSIGELLSERFFVPTYQRGYRWTARQVEALLDDLEAFQLQERGADAYYCLQPVVVRRRDDGAWELVDGQQRLTTISLILGVLEDVAKLLRLGRHEIEYATRKGSAAFLLHPTSEGAEEYIDYHHMFAAHEAIRDWFDAREGERRLDLLRCITGRDGTGPNVRVIWYELEPQQDAVEAFVRLNVGRIPLTSSELIRAVLLRSDRPGLEPRDAQQIAHDWDALERRLQDDGYWYFLQSGRSSVPARIEYLFDVFVRVMREEAPTWALEDPLATFLEFQEILDGHEAGVWALWQEFKRLPQALEDWYEDRTLYHLVGFLVATARQDPRTDGRPRRAEAKVLLDLLRTRRTSTATDFDRHLRRQAWRRFVGPQAADPTVAGTLDALVERVAERVAELEYGRTQVGAVLLLFNIAGLLQQRATAQHFQFDGYKLTSWDIEHVRSVAEHVPRAAADRKRWLEHARDFVESGVARAKNAAEAEQLHEDIAALLELTAPDEQKFAEVFARVRTLSGEPEARTDDNGLSNLVLLDMGTNRSYKNALFPVKRTRIIALDKQGQFVPPATRNVFLKYYSPEAAQLMLWDDQDQRAYADAIEETLVRFFSPLLPRAGA